MDKLLREVLNAVKEATCIEWINRTERNTSDKAMRIESEAIRKANRLINEYVAKGGKREDILG